MNRLRVLLPTVIFCAASSAFGALGNVVASFPSPAPNPEALTRCAVSDDWLYVFCNNSPWYIYRVNAETGSVLSATLSPWTDETRGLAYMQGNLYMVNEYNDRIYVHHYTTMSIIASFYTYHDVTGGLDTRGTSEIGSGATELWSTRVSPPTIFRHNIQNGSVLSSFPAHSSGAYDCAWDWRSQVLWAGGGTSTVYGYNTNGTIVASFTSPALYPRGMTYYNYFLWIGTTTGSNYIWKVECPNLTGIRPVSFGRVKTLFE